MENISALERARALLKVEERSSYRWDLLLKDLNGDVTIDHGWIVLMSGHSKGSAESKIELLVPQIAAVIEAAEKARDNFWKEKLKTQEDIEDETLQALRNLGY